jgi:N-acetylneuraminic acid mutarotase
MVTLNNDIIIFGGYNGINPLNDFYKLTYIPPVVIPPVVITDPTSDSIPFYIPTLSIKLETTPSIQIISPYYMAAIKNDIYIYESYKTGLLNTLYKIDTLTNKIVYSNNIRGISSRVSTMMVAINNDLYIFGGFDLKNYLNDFYKINTLTCNVSYSNIIPNIPGRRDHNMITIGNDIYIFGGFNIIGYEQSYLNDFHKISTLTCNVSYSKTFTEIQTRQQSSMAAINNNIYIFGGYNDGSFLNDFYKINTLTCNVSYINNNFGISKRRNHSMVAINSNLYIFGGYYYANSIGVKYNDYYRIDSTNCNISTIYNNSATNVIPVKSGHSMTTIGNDIYIFGDNGVINDFYKITKE